MGSSVDGNLLYIVIPEFWAYIYNIVPRVEHFPLIKVKVLIDEDWLYTVYRYLYIIFLDLPPGYIFQSGAPYRICLNQDMGVIRKHASVERFTN